MNLISKLNNFILLILAMVTPFLTTFTSGVLKIFDFNYLLGFLIIYYFIFVFVSQKKIIFTRPSNITLALLLLFLTQTISGLFAYDFDLAYQNLFFEVKFIVIFFILNSIIVNNDSYEKIFQGLLLGFLISCVIAVFQYLGYKQFSLFTDAQLNKNAGLVSENSGIVIRIWGPVGNSLTFSEYLSVTGIALYSYYRMLKRRKIVAAMLLILTCGIIILTVGRIALFATFFTFLLLEFIYAKINSSRALVLLVPVLIIALIAVLLLIPGIQDNGNPLINRFSNASEDFKKGRLNLWVKGFDAFLDNIFFGVGPGNLHRALSSEGFPLTSEIIAQFDGQHVENYYLTILYTFGIIGFFFCLQSYYYLVRYSYKIFKLFNRKINTLAYGGVMFGSVIALLLSNITNPALIFDERIRMLFIFIVIIINNSYFIFNQLGFLEKKIAR